MADGKYLNTLVDLAVSKATKMTKNKSKSKDYYELKYDNKMCQLNSKHLDIGSDHELEKICDERLSQTILCAKCTFTLNIIFLLTK